MNEDSYKSYDDFYIPEVFDKLELAEKIKAGTKLNNKDRENLYFHLTGNPLYLTSRGHKSEDERNKNLAFDFISNFEMNKKNSKKFRIELFEKYFEGDFKDNTFSMALNKGLVELNNNSKAMLEFISQNPEMGSSEIIDKSEKLIADIDAYSRNMSKHTSKRKMSK